MPDRTPASTPTPSSQERRRHLLRARLVPVDRGMVRKARTSQEDGPGPHPFHPAPGVALGGPARRHSHRYGDGRPDRRQDRGEHPR
ncbi:hypothetical protein AQF52_1694 [Streptomyces venezuelae]|nr:hypothetical protein AQF52_1694 [Streptomyces venezuelae]